MGKGYSKAEVIYSFDSFGRKAQPDVQAVKRLVKSLGRFLSSEDALKPGNEAQGHRT